MLKLLGRWLNIYEDEINLFFWTALLLFLIRSSNILFNNFAETAFLKRFGYVSSIEKRHCYPLNTSAGSVAATFLNDTILAAWQRSTVPTKTTSMVSGVMISFRCTLVTRDRTRKTGRQPTR